VKKANIVIMGKTGTGKSTIVNAVMEDDVAPTGRGRPVTLKNDVYSKSILLSKGESSTVGYKLNLHYTVGLELDNTLTKKTLEDIKNIIKQSQNNVSRDDVNVVWFCVNNRSNRFEPYEIDLIKMLAYDYEIPFVIVITQCFSDEIGELEQQIRYDLPEVSTMRILAKDYNTRAGVFPAFGWLELLKLSIFKYNKLKVRVLQSKFDNLQKSLYISEAEIEQIFGYQIPVTVPFIREIQFDIPC
jgi:signal recognition particle receptor subunit beta